MCKNTCKNKCKYAKIYRRGITDSGHDVECFNELAIIQFAREEGWLETPINEEKKWLKEFRKDYPNIKKEGFPIFDIAELQDRDCIYYERR